MKIGELEILIVEAEQFVYKSAEEFKPYWIDRFVGLQSKYFELTGDFYGRQKIKKEN